MSISVITVPIYGIERDRSALDIAAKLAKEHTAHVQAVHCVMDGRDVVPFVGQGLSSPVVDQIIHSVEQEVKHAKETALSTFSEWALSYGFRILGPNECPSLDPVIRGIPTVSWVERLGRPIEILPSVGRLSDLMIVLRPDEHAEEDEETIVDAVIVESARPVLMVPEKPKRDLGKNIVIFWNGSIETSRSLTMTDSFLRKADHVTLAFAPEINAMEESAEAARQYLSWRGIPSQVVEVPSSMMEIGAKLIETAHALSADTIVVGAYSHSKIRQMVLGSITRKVIKESDMYALFVT